MLINKLSVAITIEELRAALQKGLPQMQERAKGSPMEGLSDPDVKVEKGMLVFSIKKKIGFMPITFSATIGLRAKEDGEGIVLTLGGVSAGFLSPGSATSAIMQQVAQAVAGRPGLSVSGNELTVTKAALDALPMLRIPGAVRAIDILSDQIAIDIG